MVMKFRRSCISRIICIVSIVMFLTKKETHSPYISTSYLEISSINATCLNRDSCESTFSFLRTGVWITTWNHSFEGYMYWSLRNLFFKKSPEIHHRGRFHGANPVPDDGRVLRHLQSHALISKHDNLLNKWAYLCGAKMSPKCTKYFFSNNEPSKWHSNHYSGPRISKIRGPAT